MQTILGLASRFSPRILLAGLAMLATEATAATPSFELTSSPNPSLLSTSVNFIATTAAGQVPTGTMTFYDGATAICGNVPLRTILVAHVPRSTAACATAGLSEGSHAVTATYSGDASFAPVTTNTVAQVVTSQTATLSVALTGPGSGSGSGSGRVTSFPAGIDCSSTCSAAFPLNSAVTFSVSVPVGGAFVGWAGACTGIGACTVTMDAAKSVTAQFDVAFTLAVATAGAGSGVVTSSPPNINCGNSCSAIYATGTAVTLTATPDAGSTFAGWSGGGCSGTGTCTVTMNARQAVTATFNVANPPRLTNISTRGVVGTGNDVLIGGFIVGGTTSKTVVVAALGPSLAQYGITNPLANPTLTLVRSSDHAVIATNDDWNTSGNYNQMVLAGLAPSDTRESAITMTLAPGAYTAIVSGVNNSTGTAIVAVYELDHPEVPLVNISTRGQVLTGNDVMIGGFIVTGSGPQTVAIVGTGPSLAGAGIANPLANPTLTLVRFSDSAVMATNDDWGTASNAAQLQAAGLAPSDPKEAAIYITLDPGAYTAILSGVAGGTGVGIIAVYAQ